MRNIAIFFCVLLLSLELCGFLSVSLASRLYFDRQKLNYIRQISPEELADFVSYNEIPGISWHKNVPEVRLDPNSPFIYDRIYTGYDYNKVSVMMVGDSYTYGVEINNDSTIASRIYQRTGITTVNLGLAGNGPDQAFLYAKKRLPDFPKTKVVVLNIMYENIHRMVNSYRFVYMSEAAHQAFYFKPYMKDGVLVPLDPAIFTSVSTMYDAASKAFATDYWAKPKAKFPYSLSLVKAITSHAFYVPLQMRWDKKNGHEYLSQYTNPELAENLLQLLDMFAAWAKDNHVTPVVMFLPMNKEDTTSPQVWIDHYKDQLPPELIIRNFDFTKIDPNNYNLQNDHARNALVNGVEELRHPTPYAADAIAGQLSEIIQPLVNP